jgi:glycine reductase complex component B subunit gamma
VLCNLVPIARRVGAPRIVPTRGIQFPTGDPSLPAAGERAWRRRLLETALRAVATPVDGPTVFDPVETPDGVAEAPAAATAAGAG